MTTRLYLLHAMSPVHCGTGHAIGGIDLPIAREKPTGLPLVPGSSLKGVLRARPGQDASLVHQVFGPDTDHAADHAGGVQFGDARLAFLPVRSVRGTFAYVTSPVMLSRMARDAREAGHDLGELPSEPKEGQACVVGSRLVDGGRVVFEDLDFEATESSALPKVARRIAEWVSGDNAELRERFIDRVAVVHDDVMAVLQHTGMEVMARNRIDPDKGTVQPGALWTEEALPVESVLVGLLAATPVMVDGAVPEASALLDHVASLVGERTVQVGGMASVGRGRCRMKVI